jgi:curved DNA-binding protein CbpA
VIGRKTYYQILMVDQTADDEIIGVVHRRLAQRHHPDVDPSPEARVRMLEINQAYDVLRNAERRARYDADLAARRDKRGTDRYVRRPTDTPAAAEAAAAKGQTSPYGEAGPPPRGPVSGSVLDFGRYRGWSLGQIAVHDPDFLLWLERSAAGRQFRAEIGQLLKLKR